MSWNKSEFGCIDEFIIFHCLIFKRDSLIAAQFEAVVALLKSKSEMRHDKEKTFHCKLFGCLSLSLGGQGEDLVPVKRPRNESDIRISTGSWRGEGAHYSLMAQSLRDNLCSRQQQQRGEKVFLRLRLTGIAVIISRELEEHLCLLTDAFLSPMRRPRVTHKLY